MCWPMLLAADAHLRVRAVNLQKTISLENFSPAPLSSYYLKVERHLGNFLLPISTPPATV